MNEYESARDACSSLAKELDIRFDEPEAMDDAKIVELPDDRQRFAHELFELTLDAAVERCKEKTGEDFTGEGWQIGIVQREFLFACAALVRPAAITDALDTILDAALRALVADVKHQISEAASTDRRFLFPACWRFTHLPELDSGLQSDVRLAYICEAMDEQERRFAPYPGGFVSLMRRHGGTAAAFA